MEGNEAAGPIALDARARILLLADAAFLRIVSNAQRKGDARRTSLYLALFTRSRFAMGSMTVSLTTWVSGIHMAQSK